VGTRSSQPSGVIIENSRNPRRAAAVRLMKSKDFSDRVPAESQSKRDLERIFLHARGVGVVGGDAVPSPAMKKKQSYLPESCSFTQFLERAHVVAGGAFSGGTHAAQHARLGEVVVTGESILPVKSG